ncbi:MAG: agmatine deiminase family protein [Myxococcota bacterium]
MRARSVHRIGSVVHRLLLVAAAGTIAFAALSAFGASAPSAPPPARLMPAAGGPIESLAIQFGDDSPERFLEVYRQIFAALRPETRVEVLVPSAEARSRFEAARIEWGEGGRDVRYIVVGRAITSWVRDRLAILPTGDKATLLAPPQPMYGAATRVHDWWVPCALRRRLGETAVVRVPPFQFEGGDLIADEDQAFVANPLFARNEGRSAEALLADLRAELGRSIVRIGGRTREVPNHHIGMFLTPLGGGRVAYGEPTLVPRSLELPVEADRSAAMNQRFDHVRASIEAAGLTPVPIPIVASTTPFVFMSYNNVLLERRGDGLHALVPIYGSPLDDIALEAWKAAGVHPHPIDVRSVFRLGGSVRCLTAPLRRHSMSPRS